jgi:hypothetical protein
VTTFNRRSHTLPAVCQIFGDDLRMKKLTVAGVGSAILASSAIALAGPAAASTADTVVNSLQAEGYTVQINGTPTAPLTACSVTAINKLESGAASASVDIACPQGC